MEELRNFTMKHVMAKLTLDNDEFDEWLTDLGLLHSLRICPRCGREMGQIKAKAGERYGAWRCRSDICGRKEVGYLVGTFFQVNTKCFHLSCSLQNHHKINPM